MKQLLTVLSAALWAASSLPAQTLRITSPADGTVVKPGETLAVTVAASGAPFRVVVLVGYDPIGTMMPLMAPPYRFSVPIPSTIRPGRYLLTAIGSVRPDEDHNVQSDPVSIDVERPDAPVSIRTEPSSLSLEVGGPGYLRLVATYADSSEVDIGRSTLTACTSDSPDVATTTNDGRVVATGAGSAKITVENGGQTAIVPVTVTARRPAPRP
jgi:uncharacterized protein YjdB